MIVLVAHLVAGVALLLWSVRLIRTGVERAFLPELKRALRNISGRHLSAACGGLLAAMLMQSSMAVALIAAGFAASGMLALPAALALVVGADLGSALMSQVLFLPVQVVTPFVLILGVLVFFRAGSRKAKQVGRIFIGFALVLMSLGMIRAATAPIAENELVTVFADFLRNDSFSTFLLGAALAWVMQSSLAAVLTFATFATAGIIPGTVAVALVIGANLGGAMVPFLLLWNGERPARIIGLGNLLTRGGVTLGFLFLLVTGAFDSILPDRDAGQTAILSHIAVNAVMFCLAVPFVSGIARMIDRILPSHTDPGTSVVTALDTSALDHPPLALACAQRELLRMAETVQTVLVPVIRLFRAWDEDLARMIELRENDVDRMHFETKIYLSRLRETSLTPEQDKRTLDIVALANNLEEASDRIAVNLCALSKKMRDGAITFSPDGLADLEDFHDQVVSNGKRALSVLTTGDVEAARELVAEKDRIRFEEQRLQERHLKRLQAGASASIETTNIHQEVLRILKQINAALTYAAYPIVEETGDLLGSRLARRTGSEQPI